jgi:hypothetical protein
VAYISKDETPIVETFALSPENVVQQTITVPAQGGVIVVGAMAPLTNQESEFRLVIQVAD